MKIGIMDFEKLLQLLRELNRHEVEYVLVGAVAMIVHGIVRTTSDVDLFVRPEAANIERLRATLVAIWDDPAIAEITVEDLAGDFPAVRYVPPEADVPINILARLGTAFRFEDIESQGIEFDGVPVTVATPRMLHRMKRDTARLQDQADAEALREHFGLAGD
jgi:hypothetical protein